LINKKLFSVLLVLLAVGTAMTLTDLNKVEAQAVTGTVDIFAGEYGATVSYWGNTRSDGYTTVRLQTRNDYPLVYFTFKKEELPVTIRLGGVIYNITYYDNTKISLREIG
jgi:hypothetical protein